jgi:protein-glutamine gamma-glutamyltransferase
VYERDAHAWVEAYLEPEHIPDGVFGESLTPGSGAWYRLDPTPARSDPLPLGRGLLRVADQALDYIQLLWTNWVLDMNPDRQPEVGLEGLAEEGTKYLANLRVVSRSFEIVQNLLEPDRQDPAGGAATGGRFATILAGLLGLLLLAAIYFVSRRFLLRRRRRRVAQQELERRQRELRPVAFYVRLEKLLGQLGYRRQPTQTQREFIHSVDGRLEKLDLSSIPFAPEELVELYYRVRFGHWELGTDEASRIAESLDQLENSLQSLSTPEGPVG